MHAAKPFLYVYLRFCMFTLSYFYVHKFFSSFEISNIGSYGRPPRNPQQAIPNQQQQSPAAAPWQVGSPANMASIEDLQVDNRYPILSI